VLGLSEANRTARHAAGRHSPIAQIELGSGDEGVDTEALVAWLRRHQVLLGGLVLIAAQLVWKFHFLSHLFFTVDDFYNLDLAIGSPLSWHYLTFIGIGHLMPGPRAIFWALARMSLYNWGLASGMLLVLQACASLAALRLLRTLFGDRPVILIPLAVYLLTPLTMPDLGWLSAALESVPLQLAIFMALNAHVCYVRTGRGWHLADAAFWVTFGLVFFEKALVLPPLLFAVTAAFFAGDASLLVGAWRTLLRYWRAWLVYAVLVVGYAVLLAGSLRTSAPLQPPGTFDAALKFAWSLVRQTFLPGAVGGPWQWYPIFGGSYSLAAPSTMAAWLAAIMAALVLGLTIVRRHVAWRAWAVVACWIVAADIVPVILGGRISGWALGLHALETHYLADASAILTIGIGLALLPPVEGQRRGSAEPSERTSRPPVDQVWRMVAPALFGVFVFGSIWSVQAYENVTTGQPAARYISNARQALMLAPRGAAVLDTVAPDYMVNPGLGKYQYTSSLVGAMARGKLANRLHWISHPEGTIDGLLVFGTDGRLYRPQLYGVASIPRTAKQGCWPERRGQIVVKFTAPTSTDAWELRIGYIWYPKFPSQITVNYGSIWKNLDVRPGLHSAYMPVTGSVRTITIGGLGSNTMCIGDAEAGTLMQAQAGPVIPPISH
jgi:hypothetical protein